jgi:hypothetical protein
MLTLPAGIFCWSTGFHLTPSATANVYNVLGTIASATNACPTPGAAGNFTTGTVTFAPVVINGQAVWVVTNVTEVNPGTITPFIRPNQIISVANGQVGMGMKVPVGTPNAANGGSGHMVNFTGAQQLSAALKFPMY